MSDTTKKQKRTDSKEPSRIGALFSYFENARAELGKVSWATKKEIKVTCIAVLALVCIMSVFLGVVDLVLSKVVQSILTLGI